MAWQGTAQVQKSLGLCLEHSAGGHGKTGDESYEPSLMNSVAMAPLSRRQHLATNDLAS